MLPVGSGIVGLWGVQEEVQKINYKLAGEVAEKGRVLIGSAFFCFDWMNQSPLVSTVREESEAPPMIAYEFYWVDKSGESHFFAILPERRKNPERISEKSIMRWGKMVLGGGGPLRNLYFVKVEIPEN